MNKKMLFCAFVLNIILLSSGCADQSSDLLQDNSESFGERSLANNFVQPEADSSGNGFVPLPEESISISVYEDQESGLEVSYLVDTPGSYVITCGEQSLEFEIGHTPEDIQSLTVTPWDNDSIFLVCNLVFTDDSRQCYIIDSEMFSEVMIQEPSESARLRSSWEIIEKDGAFWLYINQEPAGISADQRETLEMLGHNIQPLDDLVFHSEDDTFVCDVPLAISGEDKIGVMRLYYEFDGVGMNCTRAAFISSHYNEENGIIVSSQLNIMVPMI